jgi:hypothetical protein
MPFAKNVSEFFASLEARRKTRFVEVVAGNRQMPVLDPTYKQRAVQVKP